MTQSATPKSSVEWIEWPALPGQAAANMLAWQYQLEHSQWWNENRLREQQFKQLAALSRHAFETIPFYRERFIAAGFDPNTGFSADTFSRLPILNRNHVQDAGEALLNRKLPKEHGLLGESKTSGSTGRPLKCLSSQYSQFIWQSLTLREHLWHQRNFQGKLAVIRIGAKNATLKSWGPPTDYIFETGPAVSLDIKTPIDVQAKWLLEHEPDYLLSYPSNILGLANYFLQNGIKLHKLREIRTLGEALNTELRAICREAWNVPVVDMYSAQEVGYVALQCPEHEHYHVQSESVFVELIKQDGNCCQPGEIGQLVITPLHNYAMPLIRYAIGDYAEMGEPCSCGRGLPVIKHILGRERNLVTLPDGSRHWPNLGFRTWMEFTHVRQVQMVQHSLQDIEVKLVMIKPLSAADQARFISILQQSLGHPFSITLTYHDEIPRSASGKYEDFVSEIG